jgi:predicted transcriptional regulator
MESTGVSITEEKNGMETEHLLFSYDEEEMQKRDIANANASKVFTPEFIPYYPEVSKRYKLSQTETLLYGFIRFYMGNSTGRFYFTNEQLGSIFDCSESTVNNAIANLAQKKLIIKGIKQKANGGTIRFITNVRLLENSYSDYEKTKTLSMRKLRANNNKINNNKKKGFFIKNWETGTAQYESLEGSRYLSDM